jgi:hypothetical protein
LWSDVIKHHNFTKDKTQLTLIEAIRRAVWKAGTWIARKPKPFVSNKSNQYWYKISEFK